MTEDSSRDAELLQFCEEINNTFEIDIELYYKKCVLVNQQIAFGCLIPIIDLILFPYIPVFYYCICLAVGVIILFIGMLYTTSQILWIRRNRSFQNETYQQDKLVEKYLMMLERVEYDSLSSIIKVKLVQTLVKYIFRRLYFSLFVTSRRLINNDFLLGDWLSS